jgi:hypothetical protein
MRLTLILAATLALAACAPPDPQTAEANARAQRDALSYQTPVYPPAPGCLASAALTYTCRGY